MPELTLDLVARYPRPGTAIPGKIAFSPDGRLLTYLHAPEGGLARVLHAMDVATGATRVLFAPPGGGVTDANVSREEALRRERQRLRETGVTHYAWSETGATLLVPLGGDAWAGTGGSLKLVARGAIDPHLSPDGSRVAFVRDGELHVADVAGGGERRLTHDAQPGVTNGLAEYVAQEEMDRFSGLWWSRDGRRIAYEQADDRHIPVFTLPHFGSGALEFEHHRYPFAGAENARVRLGVVSAEGGPTAWMDLGNAEYLARVAWHPDGRLFAQLQSRDQKRLEVRAFDPATGKGTTLLVEESDLWVNLHLDLRFVPDTGEFLWASERSGFKHLELRRADGTLSRVLTSGEWAVDAVRGFDPTGRRVAFSAANPPTECHVFMASLDGGEPVRLTREPGFHQAVFSKDFASWVDIHDSRSRPFSVRLHNPDRDVHPAAAVDLPLVTPEMFSFRSRDGAELFGMFYKPANLPAPLLVQVYGGPHHQSVQDSWAATVEMRAQYLANEGFLVMRVDNRGSSRRGLAFEGAIARAMGTVEVRDQVDGVNFAKSKGWVDGDRVGIYGWSYGGYMTLMCLLKAPEVFKAGVAGAPNADPAGYDTHYTERYMGTPSDNPEGYRGASALEFADRLRGKLLLVHGMLDENVHFRHTARFIDALIMANKPYELLLYPSERHMPRGERDRRNMEERIVEFFKTNL
ncbi:MAG TPA: S9 family peptidase [Planctomycetota bacterium]|nr:S9 family peptidase [Planctomycetota bacterium]